MDEQSWQSLKSEVALYVDGPLRQYTEEIEQTGQIPRTVWSELKERGYLRLAAPTELGGLGIPFDKYLELLEVFSQVHGSIRVMIHVQNGIWRSVLRRANPEQIDAFVKPYIRGDRRVTFTLTEPNSGSGTDIKTTARRVGDEYLISGEKWMIIFSDVTDDFLLFCRLEDSKGAQGTMAILVPRNAPGLEIHPMAPAMGITGTAHAHLVLKDCRVPIANRLGEEGDGLDVAFTGFLDPSRTAVGMTCVGLAQRAFDLAVDYAKKRVTFGKFLSERQIIQMYVAEMATDIEAARLMCVDAAQRFERGESISAQASMAKFFATEMLQRVTDKAIQIHGGIGYFKSSEIERIYRDARMQRFEEGTAEIQKMVIARAMLQ